MNFGEKLKQIRAERGQTQPQFAEALGIEQSYLSKLENDKSVPSAEMFSTVLSGLDMDAATFLVDIDKDVLATTLRHIPAVQQFNSNVVAVQVHSEKKWLFGCALAWILGFALMLAANDGILFSNKVYQYSSPGVVLPGEAENIFETKVQLLSLRLQGKIITSEEFAQQWAEFLADRAKPLKVESTVNRGGFYSEPEGRGHRRFELVKTEHVQAPGNRLLQYLGGTIFACGFVGLFLEWRLRRMKNKRN